MGDANLQEAVDTFESSGAEVAVSYKPYMIDPRTAKDGEDKEAYCRRRWGGSGWAPTFGKWDWWPNTLNAHRLCVYLEQLDSQRDDLTDKDRTMRNLSLVKKFYEHTYDRGLNISTPDGAALALQELGFATVPDAVSWLAQGGGYDEVVKRDSYAKREMDIHGVPHFVISPEGNSAVQQTLHGAQKSRAFLSAFSQLSR